MYKPIQCTDDVSGSPPSFQAGREYTVPEPQVQAQSRQAAGAGPSQAQAPAQQDMATDSVQFQPARTARAPAPAPAMSPGGDGGPAKEPDRIVIPGPDGAPAIIATGVAQHLNPGVYFQMGHTNNLTITRSRHGNSVVTRPQSVPNTLPVTASQAVPKEHHLRHISRGLSGEWRALGRRLQLQDAMLDQLHMDYSTQGQTEVSWQMLRRWMETTYPATIQALAQALADEGSGPLADWLSQNC
ncbi:hypothetical protein ACOMHN_044617 [Nucella lapillus]